MQDLMALYNFAFYRISGKNLVRLIFRVLGPNRPEVRPSVSNTKLQFLIFCSSGKRCIENFLSVRLVYLFLLKVQEVFSEVEKSAISALQFSTSS